MNNRTLQVLLAVVAVVALVAIAAWHSASKALDESRTQHVVSLLEPAASLLKDDEALIKELSAEPFKEGDAGILSAYLAKTRRDGVPKHAAMKQRLDQLAENNTAIVTLVTAYTQQAGTPAFKAEADRFRNYAAAWRDRWNSVMELFMAGGDYAAAETPFPKAFPAAVQAEIAASR